MNKLRDLESLRAAAIQYRDGGKTQEALGACRSALELAPDDAQLLALQASLSRRSSHDSATPLPRPLPHHVADPTVVPSEFEAPTVSGPELDARADGRMDAGFETRQIPQFPPDELDDILMPVSGDTADRDDGDTGDMTMDEEADSDLDLIGPRGGVSGRRPASEFFAPIAEADRPAILARFTLKRVPAGTVIIRRGESNHPLVLVKRGRLDIRVEKPNGMPVQVATVTAGEYIGEGALLERKPATANIVAATEAELLLLAPAAFYEILSANSALWAELKDRAERRRREHSARLRTNS
ncbi:MAG TPA: cyclic nucleotide-binding domain-containing protein [Kofleriaceae bacterium]